MEESRANSCEQFAIGFDREVDGRWIAETNDLPGILVYGNSREEAQSKVEELARQVLGERVADK
jgi:predicted RNase H-like HicB family nuclease